MKPVGCLENYVDEGLCALAVHRCLAVGGDTVISKSVRGLRPPEAGALLAAAVARLQARAPCLLGVRAACRFARWRHHCVPMPELTPVSGRVLVVPALCACGHLMNRLSPALLAACYKVMAAATAAPQLLQLCQRR